MAYATGSRTQLRIVKEVSFGETPAVAAKNLRRNSDNLVFSRETQVSGEIRSDRQITDIIAVNASSEGTIGAELSYKEYDELMAAALQGAWAAFGTNGVSTTIDATFTANTITAASAPTGSSAFTTLKPGQWVQVQDAAEGDNHLTIAQVSMTVAPTSTVLTFEGTPFVVESGVDIVLSSSILENGVTQPSFTIEREHGDVGKFLTFRGMTVDQMTASLSIGEIASLEFTFMGTDQQTGDVTKLTGPFVASQTYDVMNAADNVKNLQVAGIATSCFIQDLTLNIANGLRGRTGLGTFGACDIGSSRFNVTGSFTAYFSDFAAYDKFANNDRTSIAFSVSDKLGNGYVFDMAEVKFSSGEIEAGDSESDCLVNFEFQALVDPITNKTLRITRVGE